MEKSSNAPFQKMHSGLGKPGLLSYFIKVLPEICFLFFFFFSFLIFLWWWQNKFVGDYGWIIYFFNQKFSDCFNIPQHLSPFLTGGIWIAAIFGSF